MSSDPELIAPVVITGGAGFIGSHLAEHLMATPDRAHQPRPLYLLDNLSTGRLSNVDKLLAHHPHVVMLRGRAGDLLRSGRVPLRGADVFHLAASVGVSLVLESPQQMLANNLGETAAVLEAAAQQGARRVLLASSSEVYGRCVDPPLREDGPLVFGPTTAPRWSYGMAKALDEHLALDLHRQGRLDAVVVRFFNTIGPRQRGRYGMVVPRFVAAAVAGKPLEVHGTGLQSRTFCDVRDAVDCLARLMACDAAAGEVVNVGGGTQTSIVQLARQVADLAAEARQTDPPPIVHVPYAEVYGEAFEDPQARAPDVGKVQALVGWSATRPLCSTLSELLKDAADATGVDSLGPAAGGGTAEAL